MDTSGWRLKILKRSKDTVAICEDASSVELFLDSDRVPASHQINDWLALTPSAALALSSHGINYLIVDDFLNEGDLLGDLDERLNLQVQWAMWVDHYLQSMIPEFAELNYSPAIAFFYPIKNFFDRITAHRFGLQSFLSNYRPNKVLWMSNPGKLQRDKHNIEFNYIDMILPEVLEEHGVEVEIFKEDSSRSNFQCLYTSIKKKGRPIKEFGKRAYILYQGWQLAKNRHIEPLLEPLNKKTKILVLQNTYDMAYVLPELLAMKFRLDYLNLPSLHSKSRKLNTETVGKALNKAWAEIKGDNNLWTLLEGWERGRKIVSPWLSFLWNHTFLEGWKGLKTGIEYLSIKRYSAVITSAVQALTPYETGIGFLQAARDKGIPVFSYLHGSLPGYCHQPVQVLWDMPHSDYHFVYGPGVAKYLNQIAKRFPFRHATAIAVGSTCVDVIRKKYNPDKAAVLRRKLTGSDKRVLILYIPNMIILHRRLSGDAPACMPLFELQKKVIGLFAKFRNVRLVYRSFVGPWTNLMNGYVKSCVPDAIIAAFGAIKLSDLMWAVDGIILDYPATPIREILVTNKPIIILSDKRYYKMFPVAKRLLRKRCNLSETPEGFLNDISDFLDKGKSDEIKCRNDEFFKYYIDANSEGYTSGHVAQQIIRIINKNT